MKAHELNDKNLENSVYTEDDAVRPELIIRIQGLIKTKDDVSLKELVEPLHESEYDLKSSTLFQMNKSLRQ